MGDLLGAIGTQIAAVSELDEHTVCAVRFFGEDLVLYKDRSGACELLESSHLRTRLAYGLIEKHGVRCSCYGVAGQCRRCVCGAPFEDTGPSGSRMVSTY
jgi:5,5'-dehydrodivanillate O-demethylase